MIWLPIIMYKELLTQTVQNAFLWYKKLSIINIWYCWIIIGPIRSNIPATSFYVWQSWQYIFLESRDVSYVFFGPMSVANRFIPTPAFNKSLPLRSDVGL